jgi:membrane protease YdiL (CAAX protease family)
VESAPGGRWRQTGGCYKAATPWSAPGALAATVAILLVAIVVGGLSGGLVEGWLATLGAQERAGHSSGVLLARVAAVQAAIIALVLLVAAPMYSGRPQAVLALEAAPRPATVLSAFAAMVLLLAPYNLAVYALSSDSMVQDLEPFADLMGSNMAWLAVIVIGIGAPLSEELLFRGFLQSALARSRIGYFGASLVTTMGWTALHAGYSPAGLIEVFLIGLLLSWLLWRTGSLWVPILCHAVHNTALLAVLALVELPA